MNTAARLSLYAAGLVVAFAASYGIASVVVPDGFADEWTNGTHTEQPTQPGQPEHTDGH